MSVTGIDAMCGGVAAGVVSRLLIPWILTVDVAVNGVSGVGGVEGLGV